VDDYIVYQVVKSKQNAPEVYLFPLFSNTVIVRSLVTSNWASKPISLFLLVCKAKFPKMVRPVDYAPNRLSFDEVTVHASRKVLMEVDDNSALIAVDA
jgi:hypothetical protein